MKKRLTKKQIAELTGKPIIEKRKKKYKPFIQQALFAELLEIEKNYYTKNNSGVRYSE